MQIAGADWAARPEYTLCMLKKDVLLGVCSPKGVYYCLTGLHEVIFCTKSPRFGVDISIKVYYDYII